MRTRASFFVTEGTLAQGAPCYIERDADARLFEALEAGEFAYVLDSRQKGKSSLMIRTRERLEEAGIRTILLDLQRFGSNLDPDRWYASLLMVAGEQLGIDDRLFELWDEQVNAGPMRRFFDALEHGLAELGGPVVVFVDEIDFVRSLPFSTDEFFAAIRESYNRRAQSLLARSSDNSNQSDEPMKSAVEPAHPKVTFCLLGVATPSELIRDVRITPFNIGTRVELTDFTVDEAESFSAPLSVEGRDGRALLRRILDWTNGHPYLTQKLASAVAADEAARTPSSVDRLVEALFFSLKARTDEPNLADVSRRVLESPIEGVSTEEARSRVLDAYRHAREGRLRDDDTDPVVNVLRLSGLTRTEAGFLRVRNRIYDRAFDTRWIEENLPEAELLRQRRAARRAAVRVGAIAGIVSLAIAALAVFGFNKANEAEKQRILARKTAQDMTGLAAKEKALRVDYEKQARELNDQVRAKNLALSDKETALEEAQKATRRAEDEKARADRERDAAIAARRESDRLGIVARRREAEAKLSAEQARRATREAAQASLASAFLTGSPVRMSAAIERAKRAGDTGWEGEFIQTLFDLQTYDIVDGDIASFLSSPQDRAMLVTFDDSSALVWDPIGQRVDPAFRLDGLKVEEASFSDDDTIWILTPDKEVVVVQRGGLALGKYPVPAGFDVQNVEFPWLIGTARSATVFLPNPEENVTLQLIDVRQQPTPWDTGIRELVDLWIGEKTIVLLDDKGLTVYDIELKSSQPIAGTDYLEEGCHMALSLSETLLAFTTSRWSHDVAIANRHDGRIVDRKQVPQRSWVDGLQFSPTGSLLAIAHGKNVILWDFVQETERTLAGHDATVNRLVFSRDGRFLVTGSDDGSGRTWTVDKAIAIGEFRTSGARIQTLMPIGDEGASMAFLTDGTVTFWEPARSRMSVYLRLGERIEALAPHPKQPIVAAGGYETGTIFGIDCLTGREAWSVDGPDGIWELAWSPSGDRLAIGTRHEGILMLDPAKRMVDRFVDPYSDQEVEVRSIDWSSDGRHLYWVDNLGFVRCASVTPPRVLWEVQVAPQQYAQYLNSVELSADGKTLFVAGDDDHVTALDPASGKVRHKWANIVPTSLGGELRGAHVDDSQILLGDVWVANPSPDGKRLLVTGTDVVRVVDLATQKTQMLLKEHRATVRFAYWFDGGRRIVTGGWDGKVKVWDADSGLSLLEFDHGDVEVRNAAFSDTARALVTSDSDGGVRIWRGKSNPQRYTLRPDKKTGTNAGRRPG